MRFVIGFVALPPMIESMVFQVSPFGAETIQLVTFVALQLRWVVLPVCMREGIARIERSGDVEPPKFPRVPFPAPVNDPVPPLLFSFVLVFVFVFVFVLVAEFTLEGTLQVKEKDVQPERFVLESSANTLIVFVPAVANVRVAVCAVPDGTKPMFGTN